MGLVKLSDVCEINKNTYTTKNKWKYVNYLDTGNITENKIENIQYIDLSLEKLPSRAKRIVCVNNILYSTVRPNQKHYGIVKSMPCNYLVSTGFAVIDVNSQLADPDFIYFYLTQSVITERLQAIAEQSVSAYPSIKPSDIGNLEVNLPGIKDQRKIAGLLRNISDKIALNDKINKNLEEQAQALFKAWFVDFEPFGGEVPSDWKQGNLLDIADYTNGLAMQKFRPLDGEEGLPVLKIKELRQRSFDNDTEVCSSSIKEIYKVYDGDVIFSWSGSLLVDFWCGGNGGLNQHLFKVTSEKFDKWFYYSWTLYHLNKFIAVAADMATTMGHIKRGELEKAEVFIPNKDDYEKLRSVLSPIYDRIISNRMENRKLTELRDTLIPKLMSGELDVTQIDI